MDIWGSVKLMFIVWGLAALISFGVAWIIKLIFAAIRMKKKAEPSPADKPPIEAAAAARSERSA